MNFPAAGSGLCRNLVDVALYLNDFLGKCYHQGAYLKEFDKNISKTAFLGLARRFVANCLLCASFQSVAKMYLKFGKWKLCQPEECLNRTPNLFYFSMYEHQMVPATSSSQGTSSYHFSNLLALLAAVIVLVKKKYLKLNCPLMEVTKVRGTNHGDARLKHFEETQGAKIGQKYLGLKPGAPTSRGVFFNHPSSCCPARKAQKENLHFRMLIWNFTK